MPEYLAPGVYVEEVSFRSRSIEGVSTTTTGFVGPTRYGPVAGEPELITSFSQFERIYGGLDPLVYGGISRPNYLAHAVRGFFDNGGARLYVARAYEPLSTVAPVGETLEDERTRLGIASAPIPTPEPAITAAETATLAAIADIQNALEQSFDALGQV
ncbi:MAG: phage tail protein, partial [Cyanobacteria bacterium P01_D01_bin.14]